MYILYKYCISYFWYTVYVVMQNKGIVFFQSLIYIYLWIVRNDVKFCYIIKKKGWLSLAPLYN